MFDDPRIKRVLRRYPKDDQFSDASIDVSGCGVPALLEACRCQDADHLAGPRVLDDHALTYFTRLIGIEFDSSQFDYFLHSYVRSEFFETYYDDPSVTSFPVSEDGPPSKIPLPKGVQWCNVRPENGKETFKAFEIKESNDEG